MNRLHILIVDPERDVCELFARVLEAGNRCKCYLAMKEDEASALIGDIPFDLVFLDISIVVAGGFHLIKKVRRLQPNAHIVVDGYLHQREDGKAALEHGAHSFILKPINVRQFREKIQSILGASTV